MANSPKISVVIASYNHESFVDECIESVLAQTFADFELVVTDDGSADRTADRVAAFDDPRISLHRFERNRGACAALNHCIRQSKGEFIAVLNSDDAFVPDKLRIQLEYLTKHPEIGAVFALPDVIDQRGNPLVDREFTLDAGPADRWQWLRHFFDRGNALCHPTILIRRACYDAVGLYDGRLAQVPDLDMWIRLCRKFEIRVLNEHLIKLRKLDNQKNASATRIDVIMRAAWEGRKILDHYRNMEAQELNRIFPEFSATSHNVLYDLAVRALSRGSQVYAAFGLDLLYELMAPDDAAQDFAKFIQMTGQIDVFGIGWVSRLTAERDALKKPQTPNYSQRFG